MRPERSKPARYSVAEDKSENEEILPVSPP